MMRYLFRRMLHAAVLLMLISLLSFAFVQLAPGNYIDAMRIDPRISAETIAMWRLRYGLDQPLPVKYMKWVVSVFRGELGYSFAYGMPVGRLIWPRVQNTLLLTVLATGLSWSAALIIGIAAAVSHSRVVHSLARGFMSILLSIPDLLVALVLLMFAVRTGFFPVGGMSAPVVPGSLAERAKDLALHLVLPLLALVLVSLPVLVRHVQAAVYDSLASPFVQAARAHGISRRRLLFAYTLPAAANPLISLFGFSIGGLVSTSLLVEVIMGWPGLGPLMLESVFSRDIHVVIGVTVVSGLFLVTGNFIADLLLYASDPRIRLEK
jgi:peptide/nickel transport system permease protein